MRTLARDVRIAMRQWRRQPAFATAALCTLTLAIGANVAVFSVVDAVLLRGLPFASPERLVWIASVRTDSAEAPFSLPEFMDYRERARSFAGIAAYGNWSASLVGESVTERLQGARMSANSFEVLGLSPGGACATATIGRTRHRSWSSATACGSGGSAAPPRRSGQRSASTATPS